MHDGVDETRVPVYSAESEIEVQRAALVLREAAIPCVVRRPTSDEFDEFAGFFAKGFAVWVRPAERHRAVDLLSGFEAWGGPSES